MQRVRKGATGTTSVVQRRSPGEACQELPDDKPVLELPTARDRLGSTFSRLTFGSFILSNQASQHTGFRT